MPRPAHSPAFRVRQGFDEGQLIKRHFDACGSPVTIRAGAFSVEASSSDEAAAKRVIGFGIDVESVGHIWTF
jgi:hypothetical protein